MTVCESCGQLTPDDRDFCVKCGGYVRWEQDEIVEEPATVVHELAPPPPPQEPPPVAAPEGVKLTLAVPAVAVEPGGQAVLTGTLFNQSGIVDSFDLRIEGLRSGWWTIEPASVDLVPFGSGQGSPERTVQVRLHPPQSPEALAGTWQIELVARSRSQGRDVASARGSVAVGVFERFETRVRPQTVRAQRSAQLIVPVRNLGNAPLDVSFAGEDDEGVVAFDFRPVLATIPPGGQARSELSVRARRGVRGAERHRRLTIAVETDRQRVESHATFTQEPESPPPWRIILTLLAAVLLVWGSLIDWNRDGLDGFCIGDTGGCLPYHQYLSDAFQVQGTAVDGLGGLQGLFDTVTSLGILGLLLALGTLIGIRSGTATWVSGFLAVLLAVILFVTLGDFRGEGLWLVLAGGVLAAVAGAMTGRARA
ncbi:MAG TPA: hypothetical protein VM266_13535 [Solirubrobacteraceae bacterium]|nr:hypothetical protein [Solirubrobacteraceae bacterium]